MKKSLIAIYVLAVHVYVIDDICGFGFSTRIKNKLCYSQDNRNGKVGFGKRFQNSMITFHERMDGNVPDQSIIFIGDSLVQGLCVSAVDKTAVNYGIGSDTTAGVLRRIDMYKSIQRARILVLAVGINDMKTISNEEIIANYSNIMGKLPQSVCVIVCAILPIDEKYFQYDWFEECGGFKKRREQLNEQLKLVVKNIHGAIYLDVSNYLSDSDGNLCKEYHCGDGLHLNSTGNGIWIQHLRCAVNELKRE